MDRPPRARRRPRRRTPVRTDPRISGVFPPARQKAKTKRQKAKIRTFAFCLLVFAFCLQASGRGVEPRGDLAAHAVHDGGRELALVLLLARIALEVVELEGRVRD